MTPRNRLSTFEIVQNIQNRIEGGLETFIARAEFEHMFETNENDTFPCQSPNCDSKLYIKRQMKMLRKTSENVVI